MSKVSKALSEHKQELQEHLSKAGHVLLHQVFVDQAQLLLAAKELNYQETRRPAHEIIEKALPSEQLFQAAKDFAALFDKQVKNAEVFRLTAGSFTLMHNEQPGAGPEATIFLAEQWDDSWRATLTYAQGDGDAVQIQPQPNSASVVVRDEQTRSFYKKVTYHATGNHLYIIRAQLK